MAELVELSDAEFDRVHQQLVSLHGWPILQKAAAELHRLIDAGEHTGSRVSAVAVLCRQIEAYEKQQREEAAQHKKAAARAALPALLGMSEAEVAKLISEHGAAKISEKAQTLKIRLADPEIGPKIKSRAKYFKAILKDAAGRGLSRSTGDGEDVEAVDRRHALTPHRHPPTPAKRAVAEPYAAPLRCAATASATTAATSSSGVGIGRRSGSASSAD